MSFEKFEFFKVIQGHLAKAALDRLQTVYRERDIFP